MTLAVFTPREDVATIDLALDTGKPVVWFTGFENARFARKLYGGRVKVVAVQNCPEGMSVQEWAESLGYEPYEAPTVRQIRRRRSVPKEAVVEEQPVEPSGEEE